MKTAAIYRINEQGNLQQTRNTLDLAIQGNGYFQVTLPSGDTAYTRDGTFGLAPDGTIVTADGYVVQPGITGPANATNVTINTSGQVQVDDRRADRAADRGPDPARGVPQSRPGWMRRATTCSCRPPPPAARSPAIPASPGFGSVMQGFIETSNVNVVTEITNLITAQRAYEMNSKVITTQRRHAVHPDQPAVRQRSCARSRLIHRRHARECGIQSSWAASRRGYPHSRA